MGVNWAEEDRAKEKASFYKPKKYTPFEAYILYLGLKEHFNSEYDFFKYKGKVTATPEAFQERKDKYQFRRLANSSDPQGLLVSNFVANPKLYVKDLDSHEALTVYNKWKSRQEFLLAETAAQAMKLEGSLDDLCKVENAQHPLLFKAYLKNLVDKETLLVLNSVLNFLPYWEREIADPIVWKTKYTLLVKYQPFIMYPDENAVRKMVRSLIQLAKNKQK